MRINPYLLSLFILTAGLGSCRSKPWDITFIGPLSGRYSDMGTEGRDGTLLAVELINSRGGLNNRLIDLTIYDDRNEVDTARESVKETLARGGEIIIGPMTSTLSLAVLDLLEDNSSVIISPTASSIELSARDDGFFRLAEAYIQEGIHISRYAREEMDLTRMAVVYDLASAVYSEGWLEPLTEDFIRNGGSVVNITVVDTDEKGAHYRAARQIADSRPEVMVLALPGIDAGLICQQVKLIDNDIKIILATWAKDGDLLTVGGKSVEGAIFTEMFRSDSEQKIYVDFKTRFADRFGYEPGFSGALGYEAVMLIQEALGKKNNNGSPREAVKGVRTFAGLQGSIEIDPYGDVRREHHYGTVRGGEFIYLDK